MAAACIKGGDKLTAGKRKLVQRHWVDLNGKQVEKLTLADEYDFMSYSTFGTIMHQIGSGLVAWAQCKPNDCIIIYAETCAEAAARLPAALAPAWRHAHARAPRAAAAGRASGCSRRRAPSRRASRW